MRNVSDPIDKAQRTRGTEVSPRCKGASLDGNVEAGQALRRLPTGMICLDHDGEHGGVRCGLLLRTARRTAEAIASSKWGTASSRNRSSSGTSTAGLGLLAGQGRVRRSRNISIGQRED